MTKVRIKNDFHHSHLDLSCGDNEKWTKLDLHLYDFQTKLHIAQTKIHFNFFDRVAGAPYYVWRLQPFLCEKTP
ncbi:MAG: hypothetical protein HQM15_07510 [Deltaproteobacteria bacterium]|nr:hypothetical protein [Deltaproteobacteria bacterium]